MLLITQAVILVFQIKNLMKQKNLIKDLFGVYFRSIIRYVNRMQATDEVSRKMSISKPRIIGDTSLKYHLNFSS